MHVIYNSEYFSFYTIVYHNLPQDCSPPCVKRLAVVNETTNKCFPKDWSKWSVVEFPFRKTLWLKDINAISLLKNVNLSWRMEVNNFPKQLINVIALKLSRSKLIPLFLYTGYDKWLTPLSTIFQLYRAVVWWMTSEYPEKTTNLVASHWHTLLHNVAHIALLDFRTHKISGVFLIDLWELTKTRESHPSYPNIDSTGAISKQLLRKKKGFLHLFHYFLFLFSGGIRIVPRLSEIALIKWTFHLINKFTGKLYW